MTIYSLDVLLFLFGTRVRSVFFGPLPFLSFIEPIFAWNVPLVCLIFLKRSLVFPILLFSSISLHCSLRKAFLSLLAILWNSVFRWVYLSFSPLPLASLLFSAICKASSDSRSAFLHFFSWGWSRSLPPVQCHEPDTAQCHKPVLRALQTLQFTRYYIFARKRVRVIRDIFPEFLWDVEPFRNLHG